MKQGGVGFHVLSKTAKKNALASMLLHLRKRLGIVDGLGDRYDPKLIEYFISKLKPLFSYNGNLLQISTLYKPISKRIYNALYQGYQI
jgi:hypothetical protein